MATDYNLLGSTEVLEELQEGRTRELLMLLQDKPVPEVQDPINLVESLSTGYNLSSGDYTILDYVLGGSDDTISRSSDQTQSSSQEGGFSFDLGASWDGVEVTVSEQATGVTEVRLLNGGGSTMDSASASAGETVPLFSNLDPGFNYIVLADGGGSTYTQEYGSTGDFNTTDNISGIAGWLGGDFSSDNTAYNITKIQGITNDTNNSAEVTDSFSAPTNDPADFEAWNAIQARDVTTGGSTSGDPVEFEILDSSDTVLNSTRIPKARFADEAFTMRNRVNSENAGSDGQSDYQIASTGDGGHFGIPILSVVSVKKNDSVLDSANWSFDGTDTVTIDTANVTIASGDTIDIKYDFDVFDSTLQPRAYLSRESTSETSPSISHFRYEYVI